MSTSFEFLKVPGPIHSPPDAPFWGAIRTGKLMLQRCDDCMGWVFYPRTHCPHCWGRNLSWHEASGRGIVKSFSVIHRPGHIAWADVVPFVIVLIHLQEGPTMLSQLLVSDWAQAQVGLPVVMQPVSVGSNVLPFFVPAAAVADGGGSARGIDVAPLPCEPRKS